MLKTATKNARKIANTVLTNTKMSMQVKEINTILSMSAGTALISGLSQAKINELVTFKDGTIGVVHTLSEHNAGVIFLTHPQNLKSGDRATQTHRVLEVPVGNGLLGRIVNPLGQPLDGMGMIPAKDHLPVEREAAPIMHRSPVNTPLQTGIKNIDCFTPIGRGQRELILGDRQTGKTAIAIDTILNQKNSGVICIYCAIGQRLSDTKRVINTLKQHDMLKQTIVVIASGEDEAGLQYIAPYSATSMGEYFMEKGKDVLIVYDDLSAHAIAYRQMSLVLGVPPGREAYPGDIFYLHSRLLERATHLREKFGGGSLTALPIVSTEAGNISAYIPTNIISITDGQIYLSTNLFQKGQIPAIETGRSVSRVGSNAQIPAYRKLVAPLKLFYSQFEELESFTKFGMQAEGDTLARLKRGQAIRTLLKQPQYQTLDVLIQIGIFMAVNNGLFDDMESENFNQAQQIIQDLLYREFPKLSDRIVKEGKNFTDGEKIQILERVKKEFVQQGLLPA